MIRCISLLLVLLLTPLTMAVGQNSPALALPTQRLEIVVFSDFQCPFCASFAGPVRELETKGVEGVITSVQFKYFPLSFHPDAQLAAQAALAAKEQGKFWEMHDLLFANQAALKRADLLRYAARLKLNRERFRKDLDSAQLKQTIEADVAEGVRLGVSGTPTYFINGRGYSGARSFDQLKQLVRNEVVRTQALSEIPDSQLSHGPGNAPVMIEFFADLQSPVSRPALAVLDEVIKRYPSRVHLRFYNFPLAFHPQAPLAHEAAMTAAARGRFWEFARYILDHQESLREQDLISYAGRLDLDQVKFAELLGQHRYAARVEADIETGRRRGIRGSPVIFVNGSRIDGVPTLENLLGYVDSALTTAVKSEERRP
jgi:protein-disulfide isomerase